MEKDSIVELRKLKKTWKDNVYYNVLDGSLFVFVVACITGIKTVPWRMLLKSSPLTGFILKILRTARTMINIIHAVCTSVLLIELNKLEMNGINKIM